MKTINSFITFFLLCPVLFFCQDKSFSILKTNVGEVKIPGEWTQLNKMDDSGQTYLKNHNGIILAIAKNPQKAYPFYKKDNSDYKNVKEFYLWDSDYRKENNFITEKLKENEKLHYVIWKYNDGKGDNVFLFGASEKNFLNLLVYTNIWSQNEKIKFLEKLYEINK